MTTWMHHHPILKKKCHLGNSTLKLLLHFPSFISEKTNIKNSSTDGTKGRRSKDEDEVEVHQLLPTSQVVITFAGQMVPANRNAAL